jgi:hypothetical protein
VKIILESDKGYACALIKACSPESDPHHIASVYRLGRKISSPVPRTVTLRKPPLPLTAVPGKSSGPQPRKSPGPQPRKFCTTRVIASLLVTDSVANGVQLRIGIGKIVLLGSHAPLATGDPRCSQLVVLLASPALAGASMFLDATGVGKPVADLFERAGIKHTPIWITARRDEQPHGAGFAVPKLILISRLQAALHSGELKIAKLLPEAGAFVRELREFRASWSEAGNLQSDARAGVGARRSRRVLLTSRSAPARLPTTLRWPLYIEGFDRFVTSTTAQIAAGRSGSCRVALSPPAKALVFTTQSDQG